MEKYEDLVKLSKHDLINCIYNNWIAARQYKYMIPVDRDCNLYYSSFAYLSSYWRWVDFAKRNIPIAKKEFQPGKHRIGVFTCNKCDLISRPMTPQEFSSYVDFIDVAMDKELLSGWPECHKILKELYWWVQTLEVEGKTSTDLLE